MLERAVSVCICQKSESDGEGMSAEKWREKKKETSNALQVVDEDSEDDNLVENLVWWLRILNTWVCTLTTDWIGSATQRPFSRRVRVVDSTS